MLWKMSQSVRRLKFVGRNHTLFAKTEMKPMNSTCNEFQIVRMPSAGIRMKAVDELSTLRRPPFAPAFLDLRRLLCPVMYCGFIQEPTAGHESVKREFLRRRNVIDNFRNDLDLGIAVDKIATFCQYRISESRLQVVAYSFQPQTQSRHLVVSGLTSKFLRVGSSFGSSPENRGRRK